MTADTELVPATSRDITALAAMLTRAFWRDPQMTWLLPDEADRARLVPWLMTTSLRFATQSGDAWTTADRTGAALWLPPAARQPGLLSMLRSGVITAPFRLGWSRFARFAGMTAASDALRKRLAPEPHWYLGGIGVDPAAQGRGIGSALMRPGLEQSDCAGLPSYLETYNPANLDFYARHGFVVAADTVLVEDGPRLWALRREAR